MRRLILADDPVTMRDVDDRINEAMDELEPVEDIAGQLDAHDDDIAALLARVEQLEHALAVVEYHIESSDSAA